MAETPTPRDPTDDPQFGEDDVIDVDAPEAGETLGGLPLEAAVHPAGSGRRRWAEHELGELLSPAWLDRDRSGTTSVEETPEPVSASGAIWEVERIPSEAEGGVVGLLLAGRRDEPAPDPAGAVAAAWDGGRGEMPGSGLARLTEMLDHLPDEPAARMTPGDVELSAPSPAPPAVWFWGDDDIYPGKVPGIVEPRSAGRRRLRRVG